jgi:ferric-dicitrate binding protein FerR (iron transport regulator)
MNEFEWRRQLRDLRQPRMPNHDLWPAIEAALDGTEAADEPASPVRAPARRRWMLGAGLAASVVLACGAGWHMLQSPTAQADRTASSTWKPADPRLAGAAIELDAARMELELAIQQAPDSAALQRLLHRTQRQQSQLRHLADRAS